MTATTKVISTMTEETQAAPADELEAEIAAIQATLSEEESATSEAEQPETEVVEESPEIIETESEKVQARFDRLTYEKHEAKRQAEAERKAREELEQRLKALESRQNLPEGKPKLSDFEEEKYGFDEEARQAAYFEALAEWKIEQKYKSEQEARQQTEYKQRQEALEKKFSEEVETYIQQNQSYYNDVMQLPLMSQDKLDLLRSQGPKMVHYLSRNPEEAAKYVQSDFASAAIQLGSLTARLQNVKPSPKASKAPDPVETIEGAGKMTKDISEMSMDEIMNL